MSEQHDVADALAGAFGLAVARASDAEAADRRRFEAPTGRRNFLLARAAVLSLRHSDGWTLIVSTDGNGRPTRAEITGQFLPPAAVDGLRRADQRSGGLLSAALQRGRNRHTRYVVRALVGE